MLVDLCSGRLFADLYGDGTPHVVALHGWGRLRSDWRPVLSGLDALAPDLPGFGRSPRPDSVWDTRQYADLLADCLQQDKLVVVGHSFGGRVAVQYAAAYPERVKGLVLTGVPLLHHRGHPAKSPLAYRLAREADKRGIIPARAMEAARQRYGSADYRAADGAMRGVLVSAVNEEYSQQMSVIRARGQRVFMVWGENDDTVPREVAHRAAEALGPNATLDVVAGSGHLFDDALARAVRQRIDQLSNSTDDKLAT